MATAASPAAPPRVIVYRPGTATHHHGEYVHPDRRVVAGQWPYPAPQTCGDQSTAGIWIGIAEQEALVCPGCGLDCT
jgi:hypothetical protein